MIVVSIFTCSVATKSPSYSYWKVSNNNHSKDNTDDKDNSSEGKVCMGKTCHLAVVELAIDELAQWLVEGGLRFSCLFVAVLPLIKYLLR